MVGETIQLYAFGDFDRSCKVRWVGEELGLTIEEMRVRPPAHRQDDYLALNPLGQVPTVRFRDQVLIESTSICHVLAEAYDAPKLWVGRGEPGRDAYLYWLAVFGETCEGRLVECAVSRSGVLGPEYFDLHEKQLRRKLAVLAEQLPSDGYLAGERLTVADVVAGYCLRLAVGTELIERERVEPYLGRLMARPAAKRARAFASLE